MRDNKVYMDLRSKAYAILNSMPTANTVAPTQTVIDPDKELRETFDKLIKDALTSGNMELYRELKVERDKLQAPQVSSATTNTGNQRVTFVRLTATGMPEKPISVLLFTGIIFECIVRNPM